MLTFSGKNAKGTINAPPSKSHTHRAFFMSSLSEEKCIVSNALLSQDTMSTLLAMREIGAISNKKCSSFEIFNEGLHIPSGVINANNSGTTMRIFSGIASIFSGTVTVTGDESLRKRPMAPLLDALSQMNVLTSSDNGRAPITITGPNRGGSVKIDGSISSQFISSLMITAPMLENDTIIEISGKISSRPYIDITADMMKRFGADPHFSGNTITVTGGTGYGKHIYRVPGDFSSAAFPLVAGALSGSVTVNGVDMTDPQGDKKIVDILRMCGADITVNTDSVTSSSSQLNGADIDMSDVPDLFPIIAVLLSTAKGKSRLYGAPQLRFKESDRIDSTVKMLRTLGADITGTDDGCVINGVKHLRGGTIEHHEDHRILMAAAVASIISEYPVRMIESNCYDISYPMFPEHMKRLGIDTEVI